MHQFSVTEAQVLDSRQTRPYFSGRLKAPKKGQRRQANGILGLRVATAGGSSASKPVTAVVYY